MHAEIAMLGLRIASSDPVASWPLGFDGALYVLRSNEWGASLRSPVPLYTHTCAAGMHARTGRTPSRNVLYRPASLLLWTIHTSPVRWLFVRSGGRLAGESTGLPQQPGVCEHLVAEMQRCGRRARCEHRPAAAYSRITLILITVAQRLAQAQCI